MRTINKIEKYQFDLDNYVLRIGEYASYNSYYAISISYNGEMLNIGLQAPDDGILPQVAIFNSYIIIGANQSVFIWNPDMKAPMCYEFDAPFYEFYIIADSIIIVYELGVMALNNSFDKIWEKSFSEIIDVKKVDYNILVLQDFNGKILKLNMLTGECI